MTIKVKLDSDTYSGLTQEEIIEATKLLRTVGVPSGDHLFPYFFRWCVRALVSQCNDPEHEKLIKWPVRFEMQEREPGFICGRYNGITEAMTETKAA